LFDKTPLLQAFSNDGGETEMGKSSNQLSLFDF